jgi:hypothetical protein
MVSLNFRVISKSIVDSSTKFYLLIFKKEKFEEFKGGTSLPTLGDGIIFKKCLKSSQN